MPKFELLEFCSLVEKHKVTVCMLVPPIALLLAREPVVDNYDLSSLRLVISGAAPLGPELEREVSKRLNTNVAQVRFSLVSLRDGADDRRRRTASPNPRLRLITAPSRTPALDLSALCSP